MQKILFTVILVVLSNFLSANQIGKDSFVTLSNMKQVRVDQLKVGDTVFVINLTKNVITNLVVADIKKTKVENPIKINLSSDSSLLISEQTLLLSNHSWLCYDKSAITESQNIPVKDLKPNSFVVSLNQHQQIQSILVENISKTNDPKELYSIVFNAGEDEFAFLVDNVFISTFYNNFN